MFYDTLNKSLPMKAKIFHCANDFGQIDILLVAKSLDRRIISYVSDEDKMNIAENCYTSMHRRVKYVSNIDSLNSNQADILLLNNVDAYEKITLEFIKKFKYVFILNSSYPIVNLEELNYVSTMLHNNVISLQKGS